MLPLNWIRSLLRPRTLRPIRLHKNARTNFRPDVDRLEDRLQPSATVPSIDGTGNNLAHPDWGSAGADFLRTAPAAYGDGISTPAGADRPNARTISNAIADQPADAATNDRDMSAFIYAWGQFIDHDLDLTNAADPKASFNISIPTGDAQFDPNSTGTQTIPLSRSAFDPATGTSKANPRQQKTDITAWLDGSMIYGSDAATATSLRTLSGGHLKTSAGNNLPVDPASGQFIAGDIRAAENPELTAIQTLFVREHNRIADQIAAKNPSLKDEDIYQQARLRVIAELQAITYSEFLPALLGSAAPGAYRGYNPTVNPGIANEFATAAYRIGHTLVGDDIEFLDNNGNEVRAAMDLKDAFFNPSVINETGIGPILKYLASDNAQEVDTKIVGGLRNFLFGQPGQGGMDLAALNIQRGRDHGLADYNTTRAAYGLPRVRSFAEITSDPALQKTLKDLYGSVDKIDLWVGGLAEDHIPGASVGPTFARIISNQFARLRDGDRFWYQNVFSGQERQNLENTTLADVIRRNTNIDNLQANVFFFKTSISGQVLPPQLPPQQAPLSPPKPGQPQPPQSAPQPAPQLGGIVVNLLAEDGSIAATTKTRGDGSYTFTGVDLGTYRVQIVLANNEQLPPTPAVSLTKGGDAKAPNITLPAPKPAASPLQAPLPAPLANPLQQPRPR